MDALMYLDFFFEQCLLAFLLWFSTPGALQLWTGSWLAQCSSSCHYVLIDLTLTAWSTYCYQLTSQVSCAL